MRPSTKHWSENTPEAPGSEPVAPPIPSFTAWLWRGDKHDQIGSAAFQQGRHHLLLEIGAGQGDEIVLRPRVDLFKPTAARKRGPAPASFTAWCESQQVGEAWPNTNGIDQQLHLSADIPDGAVLILKPTGHYLAQGEKPKRVRRHGMALKQ